MVILVAAVALSFFGITETLHIVTNDVCSTGVKTSHWSRYGASTAADRRKLRDGEDSGDTMLGPDHIAETHLLR